MAEPTFWERLKTAAVGDLKSAVIAPLTTSFGQIYQNTVQTVQKKVENVGGKLAKTSAPQVVLPENVAPTDALLKQLSGFKDSAWLVPVVGFLILFLCRW